LAPALCRLAGVTGRHGPFPIVRLAGAKRKPRSAQRVNGAVCGDWGSKDRDRLLARAHTDVKISPAIDAPAIHSTDYTAPNIMGAIVCLGSYLSQN
jgi:hypothetical protein